MFSDKRIIKYISVYEISFNLIQIPLAFSAKGWIDNKTALIQTTAGYQTGHMVFP